MHTDEEGNEYVWSSDFMHSTVEDHLKEVYDIKSHQSGIPELMK